MNWLRGVWPRLRRLWLRIKWSSPRRRRKAMERNTQSLSGLSAAFATLGVTTRDAARNCREFSRQLDALEPDQEENDASSDR